MTSIYKYCKNLTLSLALVAGMTGMVSLAQAGTNSLDDTQCVAASSRRTVISASQDNSTRKLSTAWAFPSKLSKSGGGLTASDTRRNAAGGYLRSYSRQFESLAGGGAEGDLEIFSGSEPAQDGTA
jgi:hypothetical protein